MKLKTTLTPILLFSLLVSVVYASSLFYEEFSSGDLSLWDSNSKSSNANISVQNGTVYNGTYALRAEIEASGSEWAVAVHNFDALRTVSAQAQIMFYSDMADTVQNKLFDLRSGSTIIGRVGVRNVGGIHKWVLYYRNSSSYYNSIESNVIPSAGTWYNVEMTVCCSSANNELDGYISIYINGEKLDCSLEDFDTDYTTVSRLEVGNASGESINFIDSVKLNTELIGYSEEETVDITNGNGIAIIGFIMGASALGLVAERTTRGDSYE